MNGFHPGIAAVVVVFIIQRRAECRSLGALEPCVSVMVFLLGRAAVRLYTQSNLDVNFILLGQLQIMAQ